MIVRYPIGCSTLDDMLTGGIEAGIVTQIYGESGSGKTNLCLQFAKTTLVANPDANVAFVDTEGLSIDRVDQIFEGDTDLHSRFILSAPTSLDEQKNTIDMLKELVPSGNIKAVIVDSLTIFYRRFVNTEMDSVARKALNDMIVTLLALARRYRIPVVITNQVYTDTDTQTNMPLGGNIVAHNTKTIIELRKLSHGYRLARLTHHRSLEENREARFRITDKGIEAA